MAEAEDDAHEGDSGDDDSDDHSPEDDAALDHAYEIARLRDEADEALDKAREDHIQELRRLSVGSCLHGARSVLTCV
jgi:hypothetical protein